MKIRLLVLLLFLSAILQAQYDSTYYYSYKSKITARLYFSNKSTALHVRNIDGLYSLDYKPNTTRNIGIGATHKSFTLNLAYGFGFLDPREERGKTKYLDLQFHGYGRKMVLDVFGQFYKGFYLAPKGYGTSDGRYYIRPDIQIDIVGATVQYIFNSRKFSYRASFLQNEWQRKSAGTFLIGLETYVGSVISDSTLFPTSLNKKIADRNYNRINFFELGPNFGYAHTLVYKKHFFLTGSSLASLDLGNNIVKSNIGNDETIGFSINTLFRISAGYNSYLWAISILYITNNIHLAFNPRDKRILMNTSNLRLNVIRRFTPGKKVKKYLKVIKG